MTQRGWWIVGGILVLLLVAAAIWYGMGLVVESDVRGVPLP